MQVDSPQQRKERLSIRSNSTFVEYKMAPKSYSKEAFIVYNDDVQEIVICEDCTENDIEKTTGNGARPICGKSINKEYKYDVNSEICQEGNLFSCEVCGKKYWHYDSVMKHKLNEHSDNKKSVFFAVQKDLNKCNGKNINNHVNFNKSFPPLILQLQCDNNLKEKAFNCNICGMKYMHQDSLELHKKIHREINEFVDLEDLYTCEVCGEVFQHLKQFIEHVQCVPDKNRFECKICDRTFAKSSRALECEITHKLNRTYTCEICYRIFYNFILFKEHVSVHGITYTRKTAFTCEICDKIFDNEEDLVKHREIQFSDVCGRWCKIEKELKAHTRSHTEIRNRSFADAVVNQHREDYLCEICGESYERRAELKIHRRSHTREKRPYKCLECLKSFTKFTHLVVHKRIHTRMKPFLCRICNEKFRWKFQLQVHQAQHGIISNHRCEICLEYFITYRRLKSHVLRHFREEISNRKRGKHKILKSDKKNDSCMCEVCGKMYSLYGKLRVHKIRTHLKGEEQYECNICKKMFLLRERLLIHIKNHSSEKTFSCDICHKSFINKRQVREHMLSHSNERPHECNICGMRFKLKGHLRNHHKTHMDIMFGCDFCRKSFKTKTTLKRHFLVHIDEQIDHNQIEQN